MTKQNMERQAAQYCLDEKFNGKYVAIPKETIDKACWFLKAKLTTAYLRQPSRESNTHFSEAAIVRALLSDNFFGLKTDEEFSKIAKQAKRDADEKANSVRTVTIKTIEMTF